MEKDILLEENENLQKKKKLRGKSEAKRRSLDIDDGGKIVSWYDSLVRLISEHGMKRMLQAFVLIVASVSFLMFANALNNEEIIEQWLIRENEAHVTGTEIRNDISPKVQHTLTKMLYEMKADRTCVLEMHNGKENPTSLPFMYCDMSFEYTRDRIPYVSEEYENLNMSRFTFPHYIYENKFFVGDIAEIYTIDKKLAMRLETNDVKYAGIVMIHTTQDIGFLMVSYIEKPDLTDDQIYAYLSYYVQEIGVCLDYKIQSNKKK